jgi:hypothetical protein
VIRRLLITFNTALLCACMVWRTHSEGGSSSHAYHLLHSHCIVSPTPYPAFKLLRARLSVFSLPTLLPPSLEAKLLPLEVEVPSLILTTYSDCGDGWQSQMNSGCAPPGAGVMLQQLLRSM